MLIPAPQPVEAGAAPSDADVRSALRAALAGAAGDELLDVVRRAPSRPGSFPLEQLTVRLAHGEELQLAFKRLAWAELGRDARLAKPRFLFDPAREASVYSSILAAAPPGPPRFVGSAASQSAGSWLFLEWVEGRELYQVGELAAWVEVARWLGELHCALAVDLDRHRRRARLIEYDAGHHRRWIVRARRFARTSGHAGEARFLDWLSTRYDVVVEALLELPRTVIHGDFNASNVLVSGEGRAFRVAPVDWELAGFGAGLMDLAALVSGDWTSAEREQMTRAYASAAGLAPFSARQLGFARLQLAIQWLGWAPPEWVAPATQRHDWFADATKLAQALEL